MARLVQAAAKAAEAAATSNTESAAWVTQVVDEDLTGSLNRRMPDR